MIPHLDRMRITGMFKDFAHLLNVEPEYLLAHIISGLSEDDCPNTIVCLHMTECDECWVYSVKTAIKELFHDE